MPRLLKLHDKMYSIPEKDKGSSQQLLHYPGREEGQADTRKDEETFQAFSSFCFLIEGVRFVSTVACSVCSPRGARHRALGHTLHRGISTSVFYGDSGNEVCFH